MADFHAIAGVCEAVIKLLRSNYRLVDFGIPLDFKVYTTADFTKPMEAGVSLFLYRVYQNPNPRNPDGRLLMDGRRQKTQLPIDLHFFLTAWGKDASLQNSIAGWMMRILEDTPSLPLGFLNATWADVFHSDEAVDVALCELTNEDMLRIWDGLIQHSYRLSVPYVARPVRIESSLASQENHGYVVERELAFHVPAPGNTQA